MKAIIRRDARRRRMLAALVAVALASGVSGCQRHGVELGADDAAAACAFCLQRAG